MRVITGIARGKRLTTVPGNDIVRPTPDKVKEGVFSSIQFDIEGRRILDLFAGSGQLGIEALSRGSGRATFVDASDVSLNTVKQNLIYCELLDKADTVHCDYASFLRRCSTKFDIAFLDPPYRAGILEDALSLTTGVMSDYGIIICEHPLDIELPEEINGFKTVREYKYSKIIVTVYKKGSNYQ